MAQWKECFENEFRTYYISTEGQVKNVSKRNGKETFMTGNVHKKKGYVTFIFRKDGDTRGIFR